MLKKYCTFVLSIAIGCVGLTAQEKKAEFGVDTANEFSFPADTELQERNRIREFALSLAAARGEIEKSRKLVLENFAGSEADKKRLEETFAAAIAKANEAASDAEPKAMSYELGTADDLRFVMQLRHYWMSQRDRASLVKANSGLLPDPEALKLALKEDVDDEIVDSLLSMYQRFTPKEESEWAEVLSFRENQNDIRVYAAKTEEIARQSTEAARQFPGGAVEAAKKILKPETTFYRVEFVEPGEDAGMSFHLFFWDGSKWRMLGPVWRANR